MCYTTGTRIRIIAYGNIPVSVQLALRRPQVYETLRLLYDHGVATVTPDAYPHLEPLIREGFLRPTYYGYTAGESLVVMNDCCTHLLAKCAVTIAPSYGESLAVGLPTLRQLYESTSVANVQGYSWSSVWYILVAGLLLDLVGGQRMYQDIHADECYDECCSRGWIWVYREPARKLEGGQCFGVRLLYQADLSFGLGYVWANSTKDQFILNESDLTLLWTLHRGISQPSIEEAVVRALTKLKYHKILSGRPGALSISIPIFPQNEWALLFDYALGIIEASSSSLRQAIRVCTETINTTVNHDQRAIQQLLYRFVMEATLRRLAHGAQFCGQRAIVRAPAWFWGWEGPAIEDYLGVLRV